MAFFEIGSERRRKSALLTKAFPPAIGDWRELWIDRLAQRLDNARQRAAHIFVLPAADGVALHDNAAAKRLVPLVECCEPAALFGRQQCRGCRISALVERGRDVSPVDRGGALYRRGFRPPPHR